MIYRISHKTAYTYAEPALTCQNQVHLTPRDLPHQKRERAEITIDPRPHVITHDRDYFGNTVTRFEIDEPHDRLVIHATSRVRLEPPADPDGAESPAWEEVRDALPANRSAAGLDAYQHVFRSRYVPVEPRFADWARPMFAAGRPILEATLELTQHIHDTFRFDPRATTLATSVKEVLQQKHGVCQDFAHLLLAGLRSLRLAARYVSGYLRTDPPPGRPRLVGADASHAWVELYCPPVGWVGVDPTNACLAGDRHITLAWGRDYADVSPIQGVVLGGGGHELNVSVDVVPA